MLLNKETKQITAYLMYMPKSQWGIKGFMKRLILKVKVWYAIKQRNETNHCLFNVYA